MNLFYLFFVPWRHTWIRPPPPPLIICFEWKLHWTVLLSVSFHLSCCFLNHAQLHKLWPENKTCPPRFPRLCSKRGQKPELLLPWKFCQALKENGTFENSRSPTSVSFVRSHGSRAGYTQGMIGFTQIPLACLAKEPSGAEHPDVHACQVAQ